MHVYGQMAYRGKMGDAGRRVRRIHMSANVGRNHGHATRGSRSWRRPLHFCPMQMAETRRCEANHDPKLKSSVAKNNQGVSNCSKIASSSLFPARIGWLISVFLLEIGQRSNAGNNDSLRDLIRDESYIHTISNHTLLIHTIQYSHSYNPQHSHSLSHSESQSNQIVETDCFCLTVAQ